MSRLVPPALTGLLLASLLGGCGARRATAPAAPEVTPVRTLPAGGVFVLEAAGIPPQDTVVTLVAGAAREVVLRHGPPDQATLAVVTFPAAAFTAPAGSPVTVRLRPRPGVYGLDVASDLPFTGARLVFKYARHFSAPADARRRYGSDVAVEQALAIGRLLEGGAVRLLASSRPATDNLAATLEGPGSYVVAAPR